MLPALVEGDSLAVGMRAALTRRVPVAAYDAKEGRSTEAGLARLLSRDLRHKIVVVSLGTNDLGRSSSWISAQARRVVRAKPRCVIWGEIRVEGTTLDNRLNDGLRGVRGIRLVSAVRPDAGDGIHLSAAGYTVRAQRFARAARGC